MKKRVAVKFNDFLSSEFNGAILYGSLGADFLLPRYKTSGGILNQTQIVN
jgi:hypothetical protein